MYVFGVFPKNLQIKNYLGHYFIRVTVQKMDVWEEAF